MRPPPVSVAVPSIHAASQVRGPAFLVHRREDVFPPDPRPRERWFATFALTLEAFGPGPDGPGLLAASQAMLAWVLGAGADLGVQLRFGWHGGQFGVDLVVGSVAATEPDARARAEARLPELVELFDVFPVVRFRPIDDLAALAERVEPLGATQVAVARPGGAALPLAAEALDDGALAQVLALLERRAAPTGARPGERRAGNGWVLLSCRAAPPDRAVHAVADRLSAALAAAHTRAGGVTLATPNHTFRQLPADLVPLLGAAHELQQQAVFAHRLRAHAVEVQVAVATSGAASAPLLQAVHRALVPSIGASWEVLDAPSALAVWSGAGPALDLPVYRAFEPDAAPGDGRIAERYAPVDLAARLLRVPQPAADGLPGIPVDPVVRRPIPHALRGIDGGARLGVAVDGLHTLPARLGTSDLARHVYVVGKTGVGKSTVVASLLADVAARGDGLALIDPHGDLADMLLQVMDRSDVVVFDPADERSPALDPLAHDGSDEGMERVMEELTGILFRLFAVETMGPMFERHSRNLLLPILASGGALSDVSRLPVDADFRKRAVAKLRADHPVHAEVRRFWEDEYPKWNDTLRSDMNAYTVSKYDSMVKSSIIRRVCTSSRPQLDIPKVLARGKVLVVRLGEATVGPVSAWFLGMLLVSRLQSAIFARGAMDERRRTPFVLAIDEFQKLLGRGGYGYGQGDRTLAPMLSEGRKFGIQLVLAHQYAAQLDPETRHAVFGNVGSFVCFRSGADDAELIARELEVGAPELRGLPLHHAVCRILVDGRRTPVFTLRTTPLVPGEPRAPRKRAGRRVNG